MRNMECPRHPENMGPWAKKQEKHFLLSRSLSLLTRHDGFYLLFRVISLVQGDNHGAVADLTVYGAQPHHYTYLTLSMSPRPPAQAQVQRRAEGGNGGWVEAWGRWPITCSREGAAAKGGLRVSRGSFCACSVLPWTSPTKHKSRMEILPTSRSLPAAVEHSLQAFRAGGLSEGTVCRRAKLVLPPGLPGGEGNRKQNSALDFSTSFMYLLLRNYGILKGELLRLHVIAVPRAAPSGAGDTESWQTAGLP